LHDFDKGGVIAGVETPGEFGIVGGFLLGAGRSVSGFRRL
jgi:hypothetical protein